MERKKVAKLEQRGLVWCYHCVSVLDLGNVDSSFFRLEFLQLMVDCVYYARGRIFLAAAVIPKVMGP